jgi:hypothetical protein
LSDFRTWFVRAVDFSRASFSLFPINNSVQEKLLPKDWGRAIKNFPLTVKQVKDLAMT